MNGKKRVFFGLLSILILLMALSIFFLFYIVKSRSSVLYNFLIGFVILFFFAITIVLIFTAFGFLYVIYTGKNNEMLNKTLLLLIDELYPLLEILGGIFGVEKERIQQSFTNINNFLVSSRKCKYLPEELLILTPHCIQFNECKFKVTNDIDNCRKCGKCQVNDLISLCQVVVGKFFFFKCYPHNV